VKVLHLYKAYLPDSVGGVEQVINQVIRSTEPLGVESEVLSFSHESSGDTVMVDGHKVSRCSIDLEVASTPFSWRSISLFKRLAKDADIIHYHYPYPFADLLHFLTGVKKPSLVTYHSDIIKQKLLLQAYRPLKRRFLASIDRIVATSPNYIESSPVLSSFIDKTTVVPIGLDRETYCRATPHELEHWRNRFNGRFFLFIGVIRYYKGLHILVEAIKSAPYPVVIVGSGPLEQELKTLAENQGVSNAHFLGFVSNEDKAALLELSYALVFPSHLRSEAFGVSLLEGAMYGKPLISCEIGTGTSYINVDGVTGVVVSPNDAAELRQAMDFLWDNPLKAQTMGEASLARYEELFTARKMAAAYYDLYCEMTSSRYCD